MMRPVQCCITLLAACAVFGCESTAGKEDGSLESRQDSALKDPFSYGPSTHDPKKAPKSGGSQHPGDADAKTEWERFWNP